MNELTFYRLAGPDAHKEAMGTVTLEGGKAVIHGEQLAFLAQTPVRVDGRLFVPDDGEAYLTAVLRAFGGSQVWAEPTGT